MSVQRFLVRYGQIDSTSVASLAEFVATDAASHGCSIRGQEDLSLVMGEICLAVETEGQEQQLSELVVTWKSRGLRIDCADTEVHELGDSAGDTSEAEVK